jgi:hypothetical protein
LFPQPCLTGNVLNYALIHLKAHFIFLANELILFTSIVHAHAFSLGQKWQRTY